ncbi:MAG: hypothetical protein IT209_05305 [Armatimonadetes bacterium]|nr:hypothetical protein [Armatimonadota bacterium]
MRVSRLILVCILLLIVGASARAQSPTASELFSIRIENVPDGRIQVKMSRERVWTTVGHVLEPAVQTVSTFAAAAYVPAGAVAATAVHGIRIRTPSSGSAPVGISIQPREFRMMPERYGGHIPGKSAVVTDIGAGEAIFREFAPLVGDPVQIETSSGLQSLPQDWQPTPGDVLVITSSEPARQIVAVEFENRAGGAVTTVDSSGERRKIGVVRQAVRGIGRFDGTSYTGVGAVNTNHGGVITISTAPATRPVDEGQQPESRGGFEIQPYQHSKSQPPMPQAMIVAPLDNANTFEGEGPLFYGMLTLGNGADVVDMRVGNGPWRALPALVGKIDDALTGTGLSRLLPPIGSGEGVSALRIRREARSYKELSERLKTLAKIDTAPSTAESSIEWTLKMPYPPSAAYAVFTGDGKIISVTNITPFRVTIHPKDVPRILSAEIIGSDGQTLETRTGKITLSGGKLTVVESSNRHANLSTSS